MDSVFDKNEGLELLNDHENSEASEGTLPIEEPEILNITIKEINGHLLQKLNKGRMHKSDMKWIAWKQLKRTDFINWPDDVRVNRISSAQGKKSLEKLHSTLKSIDFTREFLDRYSRINP
jgi:hypothetical protein